MGVTRVEPGSLLPYGSDPLWPAAPEAAGCAYALGAIAHVLANAQDLQVGLQQGLDHLRTGLNLAAAGLVPGDGDAAASVMSHRPDLTGLAAVAATGRELVAAVGQAGPLLSQAGGSGWAALPVLARGRNHGALWAHRSEGPLTAMHMAALSAAAAQFGLALALRQAERRLVWVDSTAGAVWAQQGRGRQPQAELPPLAEPLSDREVLVLRGVVAGRRNKQIAQDLHISENTVKFHLQNIYQKLGVGSRTEAYSVARERGLLD